MTKICLAVVLTTFAFILSAFGQNLTLKNDLDRTFRKVHVDNVDRSRALRRTETGRPSLALSNGERTFEMSLEPRDLRAPNFRAEDTSASGTRRLAGAPVLTYKGKIDGESFSEVRLTIDGDEIEGYFLSGSERYFVEPARRFSRAAADGDLVVYRREDLREGHSFACAGELSERFESGRDFVAARMADSVLSMQVIELATEADYDYVTSYGGASVANQKVLTTLNMVEGVYENELGLTISLVFQHTWSTPDPFTGATSTALLQSFQNYWNANYPLAQYPRDSAHLFTAKANVLAQGYAYLGTVCRNPAFAYGLSGRIYPDWNWEAGNFLVTSHEIGHNLGANHAEVAQSCGDTLMNAQLSGYTALSFCTFSRGEVTNFVAVNGSCLSRPAVASVRYDFDGDRRADAGIFRPSTGTWYLANSGDNGFGIFQFGLAGDVPVAADYDGDGKSDAAVFRNGVWYRLKSATGTFDAFSFGLPTDLPVPADFDGDGKYDVAVFRPSDGSWHRLNSQTGSYAAASFGLAGDVPVPADFDGDGKADVNVFRPSNGTWYRLNSANGAFFAAQFGASGDVPQAGDFDGDGKSDLAVWRQSTGVWYAIRSGDNSFFITGFGLPSDVPVAADYDGDGKTDVAVFRPSDGVWHRLNSSNGAYAGFQFGIATDRPVASRSF